MSNSETVKKLNELNSVINEYYYEKERSESELPSEYIGKFQAIKDTAGTMKNIPVVFNKMPDLSYEPVDISGAEKKYLSAKNTLYVCLGVTAALLLLYFITKNGFLSLVGVAMIFVSIYMASKYNNSGVIYKVDKKKNTDNIEKAEKAEQEFRKALDNFEIEKENGMKAALEYSKTLSEAHKVCKEVFEEFVNVSNASETRQSELLEEMDKYDFMPVKYWHLIDEIIDLLNSGRADSYKEALNMAIAEEKENEERAQRAEEDRRRTMIMEQQAEEERRHNMRMEQEQANANRIQEAQNRAMADAERQRVRDQQRADKRATEAHYDAQRMASRRCQSCKKVSHCNMKFRGMENCAAFEPR